MGIIDFIKKEDAMELFCKKCKHEWIARTKDKPQVCPSCKTRSWMKVGRDSSMSVYVASFENGTTKIGISRNVKNRLTALSNEYKSNVELSYSTDLLSPDHAKGIEQQVLFILREFMINKTELLILDFENVKNEVITMISRVKKSPIELLSSGDEYIPVTPLLREINKERFLSGGSPFNITTWISSNKVFIDTVKSKYGDAIVMKPGGYTYAHKYVFADIGISAGGKIKMDIMEFLAGNE